MSTYRYSHINKHEDEFTLVWYVIVSARAHTRTSKKYNKCYIH